jgi:hypothetical protein
MRTAQTGKKLALWLVAISSVGVVGYSIFAYAILSPGSTVHPKMKAVYIQFPVRMYSHIFCSAIALAVGPFQFFESVRKRRQVHRTLGFIYFAAVFVGSIAGIAMATIAYSGFAARMGFGIGAILWLYTAGCSIVAIQKRRFAVHEMWATRCFALTFAAVSLRVYLGLFFSLGLNFNDFYPSLGWVSWVPNLIFVEWFLVRHSQAAPPMTIAPKAYIQRSAHTPESKMTPRSFPDSCT